MLATQNPIEQEGTYPLPEAQLDRFMFAIFVSYPKYEEEEMEVFGTTALGAEGGAALVGGEILTYSVLCGRCRIADNVSSLSVKACPVPPAGESRRCLYSGEYQLGDRPTEARSF